MRTEKISLQVPYGKLGVNGGGLSPSLYCMIHDTQPERKFPAVIAVPGGSYEHCSKREGEPCAARWYSVGYNGFVLEYSCVKKPFPTALGELAAAVSFIRENADSLCCTGDVILCGFSAGGHLAASLGVHYGKYREFFAADIRPDVMVLCYPVITSGRYAHRLSADNIAPTEELREMISLEDHVTADTPPCFIWHCADDRTVPVQNSLLFASALSEAKVPYEMHIFPSGGHGIAMCDITTVKNEDPRYINPHAAGWFDMAVEYAGAALGKKM
ncbi:MAG: alpha/beta hydrolase [Ruminococcus sp.]|nr:alpha/beta hydrolase [Ruminococcus sp.]